MILTFDYAFINIEEIGYVYYSSSAGNLRAVSIVVLGIDMLSFIEVKCSIGAREDLGRPTTTALKNKENFMKYLK